MHYTGFKVYLQYVMNGKTSLSLRNGKTDDNYMLLIQYYYTCLYIYQTIIAIVKIMSNTQFADAP